MRLEREQQPMNSGGGEVGALREICERQAIRFGDDTQERETTIQRLDRACLALRLERSRTPALSALLDDGHGRDSLKPTEYFSDPYSTKDSRKFQASVII
jgi:hypothetical protein